MSDDEGWEARMAARARERHDWASVRAHLDDEVWREELASVGRRTNERRAHLAATMTLAEAVALLGLPPWACACIGDPLCCRHSFAIARLTVRAAHIAVKLMDEVARRG